jgi:hypothetical protein
MKARALLLGALLAGCGSAPDPLANLPAGCNKMLAHCLSIQQICAEGPVCQACPDGQYAAKTGVCRPIGTAITHDFPEFTSGPSNPEIIGNCRSWTLNNSSELWINAVELTQNEDSHHSNWFFVPDNSYPGGDGIWRCTDRGFDELGAALAGGVLYAQSTQATHEVQKFPNGAAVRVPPWSTIVSDTHILNASLMTVTGHARISLYPLPAAEVKVKLAPFHLGFTALDIPPMTASRSQAQCELDSAFQSAFNHDLNAKLYYILPHYHALGTHFFVTHMGGSRDGQTVFDASGAIGEARGLAFDPPLDLSGDDGLRFGCDFDNETPDTVGWGFGNQEMCELLGFTDSSLAWTSEVRSVKPDTTAPATAMPTFTGPCGTLAFTYDFNKAGGPGPM